jgi:hypothetical protein
VHYPISDQVLVRGLSFVRPEVFAAVAFSFASIAQGSHETIFIPFHSLYATDNQPPSFEKLLTNDRITHQESTPHFGGCAEMENDVSLFIGVTYNCQVQHRQEMSCRFDLCNQIRQS